MDEAQDTRKNDMFYVGAKRWNNARQLVGRSWWRCLCYCCCYGCCYGCCGCTIQQLFMLLRGADVGTGSLCSMPRCPCEKQQAIKFEHNATRTKSNSLPPLTSDHQKRTAKEAVGAHSSAASCITSTTTTKSSSGRRSTTLSFFCSKKLRSWTWVGRWSPAKPARTSTLLRIFASPWMTLLPQSPKAAARLVGARSSLGFAWGASALFTAHGT